MRLGREVNVQLRLFADQREKLSGFRGGVWRPAAAHSRVGQPAARIDVVLAGTGVQRRTRHLPVLVLRRLEDADEEGFGERDLVQCFGAACVMAGLRGRRTHLEYAGFDALQPHCVFGERRGGVRDIGRVERVAHGIACGRSPAGDVDLHVDAGDLPELVRVIGRHHCRGDGRKVAFPVLSGVPDDFLSGADGDGRGEVVVGEVAGKRLEIVAADGDAVRLDIEDDIRGGVAFVGEVVGDMDLLRCAILAHGDV